MGLGLAALVAAAGAAACDEATTESPVPAYAVSCSVSLATMGGAEPGEVDLGIAGGWCTVTQWTTLSANIGVSGLLICHDPFDASRYYAYDLTCPACYTAQGGGRAVRTAMTASLASPTACGYGLQCPECGSEYGYVLQGYPAASHGPAGASGVVLRQYQARAYGTTIYVGR